MLLSGPNSLLPIFEIPGSCEFIKFTKKRGQSLGIRLKTYIFVFHWNETTKNEDKF